MSKLKKYSIIIYERVIPKRGESGTVFFEEKIIKARGLEDARRIAWRYVDIIASAGAKREGWKKIREGSGLLPSEYGFGYTLSEEKAKEYRGYVIYRDGDNIRVIGFEITPL